MTAAQYEKTGTLYISVDIECDGPVPGLYSMIELGAIVVEPALNRTFIHQLRPLPGAQWMPEALAVTDRVYGETLSYPDPRLVIDNFRQWLVSLNADRLIFVADNLVFDGGFVFWYLHKFNDLGRAPTDAEMSKVNPFGWSGVNLTSIWKGAKLAKPELKRSFTYLRKTKHTHNALDDARGNAEALLSIWKMFK